MIRTLQKIVRGYKRGENFFKKSSQYNEMRHKVRERRCRIWNLEVFKNFIKFIILQN